LLWNVIRDEDVERVRVRTRDVLNGPNDVAVDIALPTNLPSTRIASERQAYPEHEGEDHQRGDHHSDEQ
jgi:hypothetical protein